ncbi:inverse autotransporter beta domain-containing protein [Candidatus Pelagibacter ubique]|nr:inverse autotransporter beta domain-containing protein [Candidatus Pelagibacter ubique]
MKVLVIILSLFITTVANADTKGQALSKVSEKISEYTIGLIPGEGHTEVSIDLREDSKPNYSILAVRELLKIDSGNIFTQFSLLETEQANEEKIIGNFGLGSRKLLNEKTLLVGFNAFVDNDFSETNRRASIGLELRNSVLDFHSNIYKGLQDSDDERVLDGWDYRLASQVPYLHWSKIFINHYEWDGVLRDDIKGTKMGSEVILTKSLNLEVAYDDKDKKGLEDEWYAKIQFVHPPRNNGPTAMDGVSQVAWKENKDMSGELLSKVKRNNKIMIEFKGSATVSRAD